MNITLRDLRQAKGYFFWVAIIWIVYGHTLFFDFFVFDDSLHIFNNAHTGVRSLTDLLYFWANSLTPVIFLVWQLISMVFSNQDPAPFRALNFFLMAGIAKIMFDLAYDFISQKNTKLEKHQAPLALILVLIYVFHPSQVESVVWVSSGRTLLATFFALCSVKYYLKTNESIEFSKDSFLSVCFFVLGILSKPSVVTVPLFMLLASLAYGKSLKSSMKMIWPIILLGFIMGIMHISDTLSPELANLNLKGKFVLVIDSIASYYKLALLPFTQSFDYARNPINVISEWESRGFMFYVPSLTIVFFISFLGYVKQLRPIFFGFIGFYGLLFPNMGMIYYDFQNISTVSSRYLNFPLIILILSLIPIINSFSTLIETRSKQIKIFVSVTLIALLFANFNYSKLWNSSLEVLAKGKSVTGATYALSISLGNQYLRIGNYPKAEVEYLEAWKLDPLSYEPVRALINLYQYYQNTLQIRFFLEKIERQMIIISPDQALNMARLYFLVGEFESAKKYALISYNAKIEERISLDFYNSCIYQLDNKLEKYYNSLIQTYMGESRGEMARTLVEIATKELPNSEIIKQRKKEISPTYKKDKK